MRDLGCSIAEFREYIIAKFRGGMAWDNWGEVWELDHIQPLANFNLRDRSQLLIVCHYTNYQPLMIAEHRAKTAAENAVRVRVAA